MFDRLPYELTRQILDEAHPPLAASSSDSPFGAAIRARLRFLGNVERTCKRVQVVAHDLLWHSVWIRPGAASFKQLDRVLALDSEEGRLVRVFNFERLEKPEDDEQEACVDLETVLSAVGKMHKLVEISLRQNVKGGVVDFVELVQRQRLRSLVIEGDNLELALVFDRPSELPLLPDLRHLVLHGVVLSPSVLDNLFTCRRFPVLQTASLQRITADGKLVFPEIEPSLLEQLDSVNVAIDEVMLYQPILQKRVERVLAHVDGRNCSEVNRGLVEPARCSIRAMRRLGAQHVVLSGISAGRGQPLTLAVRCSIIFILSDLASNLFVSGAPRTNPSTSWRPASSEAIARLEQFELLGSKLETLCVARRIGIFHLDGDEEIKSWPTWAQGDPSLRRMVAVTQERDLRLEEAWQARADSA